MSEIHEIHARIIFDSQGLPAPEVEVILKNGIAASASVPGGKDFSAGSRNPVLNSIAPELEGLDIVDQMELDRLMTEAAGGESSCVTFAVSLACARAAAEFLELPLFRCLGGVRACRMPVPVFCRSGEKETVFLPEKAAAFREAYHLGAAFLRAQSGEPGNMPDAVEFFPAAHGTVSHALLAAEKICRNGQNILFRQCGSTGDDGLADLAVAAGAAFIFPGTEAQIPVCNRLLRIGEMLGDLQEYGV